MFWVQLAVAIGTLALAGTAFFNDRQRRQEMAGNRAADSVEVFLAPAMEHVQTIYWLCQPRSDPYREGLNEAAYGLSQIRLHSTRKAYGVPGKLISDLWYLERLAREVGSHLDILRRRARHVLDDIGSSLSGDTGRREYPTVEVSQGKRFFETMGEGVFMEMWLKRVRFLDIVDFVTEDFDRTSPAKVVVRHGNKTFDDSPQLKNLRGLLYERMQQEGDLQELPDRLNELDLEAERTKGSMATLIGQLSEQARA